MPELDRRKLVAMLGLSGLGAVALAGCGGSDAEVKMVNADPAAHTVTRISVSPDLSYDKLIARFEATVPPLPVAQMQARLEAGKTDSVRKLLQDGSPVGMYLFYTLDITPFMAAAGHAARARSYLIGNPLIAEKMFALDPTAMLYAPLRILIHTDNSDVSHLTLDRPSDLFASLSNPDIASTGKYLDEVVANLFSTMRLPIPPALSV